MEFFLNMSTNINIIATFAIYRGGRVKPEVHSSRKLHSDGEEQNYPNFENLTPGKRKVGDGGMGSDFDNNLNFSPAKKLRFARTKNFWKKHTGSYLSEPTDGLVNNLEGTKKLVDIFE